MATADMFSENGRKPHRKRRVLMRSYDFGTNGDVVAYKCNRCGYDSGWIHYEESLTLTEIKKGLPCPKCN